MSAAATLAPPVDLFSGGLPLGLHPNYPDDRYHLAELGVASVSALRWIGRSPLHYRTWVESAGREETDALRIGRAVHCLLLEPARFDFEYAIMPDNLGDPGTGHFRTKEAKARRDAWIAARNGAPLLAEAEVRQVRGMCESVLRHPKARLLLEGGLSELTLKWKDARTGVACKGRIDHYVQDISVATDLKSCEDASAEGFGQSAQRYRYHQQAAFYLDGLAALEGPSVGHEFAFVAVEKTPPYACAVHQFDEAAIRLGRETNARRLATLAKCLATNTWPGLPQEISRLSLSWAKD